MKQNKNQSFKETLKVKSPKKKREEESKKKSHQPSVRDADQEEGRSSMGGNSFKRRVSRALNNLESMT